MSGEGLEFGEGGADLFAVLAISRLIVFGLRRIQRDSSVNLIAAFEHRFGLLRRIPQSLNLGGRVGHSGAGVDAGDSAITPAAFKMPKFACIDLECVRKRTCPRFAEVRRCFGCAHLGGVDGFHGVCGGCALVVVVGKRISGNAPPPLITHEQEKECLPNLFILATAYKPPTSLPCLDATESTGYLTACMSSVASVSASLPCFVDGGQGTKQKGRLGQGVGLSAVHRSWDGSRLARVEPIWCWFIALTNIFRQAQKWANLGKSA